MPASPLSGAAHKPAWARPFLTKPQREATRTCEALGAEAANYARIVMAAMMADPAKTSITETGADSPSAIAVSEITEIPWPGSAETAR